MALSATILSLYRFDNLPKSAGLVFRAWGMTQSRFLIIPQGGHRLMYASSQQQNQSIPFTVFAIKTRFGVEPYNSIPERRFGHSIEQSVNGEFRLAYSPKRQNQATEGNGQRHFQTQQVHKITL
jgi:hypothetical protein